MTAEMNHLIFIEPDKESQVLFKSVPVDLPVLADLREKFKKLLPPERFHSEKKAFPQLPIHLFQK
jgi:hypothetical protein